MPEVKRCTQTVSELKNTNPTSKKVLTMPPPSQLAAGQPWIEITEQPMSKGQRFRYKCEGRSAGSLAGEKSTMERKTFPSIFVHNFHENSAIVVVSCVTKDVPHRPHPHNLVGQDCKDGVCTLRVKGPGPIVFSNIGIQCAKRQDVMESLKIRSKIRVDPYATGCPKDINSIDLNAVRLCFQVFLPDENKRFTRVVNPAVSDPIIDKKTVRDLVICRLSRQSGYAQGGDEVFLLCEKINKDDIQVRFYQDTEEGICWESFGEFTTQDIHRQFAIVFKTPPYKDLNIDKTVQVFIQLRRPSNDEVGDPKQFQFIPNETDPYGISMKRKRFSNPNHNRIPSVLHDVKGELENTHQLSVDSCLSQDIKLRLKRKAERGLQKREKVSNPQSAVVTKTEAANVPEYSFVSNSSAGYTTITPISLNMISQSDRLLLESFSRSDVMTQQGYMNNNNNDGNLTMSFLNALNAPSVQNIQQFVLNGQNVVQLNDEHHVGGAEEDGAAGAGVSYVQYLSTDSFNIESLPDMESGVGNFEMAAGDIAVGVEECVIDSEGLSHQPHP